MDQERDDIAIIGMWCRFPGADSPGEFWTNLVEGKQSIMPIRRDELLHSGLAADLIDNSRYVPFRAVLQDATDFDPGAFGITPAQAQLTDPQHRQFLECAFLALDDAGLERTRDEHIGVFAAQSQNAYRQACDAPAGSVSAYSADVFNGDAHLAANVAYRLGASGPAITVKSACSSSLVAVHLACQALHGNDCEISIAGGVSIGWPQYAGHLYTPDGIMSRDGRCLPFDANATGTVRGEGVGVLILQRLSVARTAGRHVHAIIRGSAVNNDGAGRMGFSTPSASGQAQVITRARRRAGVSAEQVSLIETHGTGTAIGDAVELAGLEEAAGTAPSRKVFIGSVKGNIGHLDAAAGIAGVIKTVLALTHRKIAPQVGFKQFHEESLHYADRFTVPVKAEDWHVSGCRMAGVSSFGLGGTNAHIVLQEHVEPATCKQPQYKGPLIFPLSATSETDLQNDASRISERSIQRSLRPQDVAYSLANRTAIGAVRFACVGNTPDELVRRLKTAGATSVQVPAQFHATFVFAHQADVCIQTLDQLREALPSFDRHFLSIADRVTSATGSDPHHTPYLLRFCVQVSMARTLIALGVQVTTWGAQGAGACSAACLSGALSIEDSARLVLLAAHDAPANQVRQLLDDISASASPGWNDLDGKIVPEHLWRTPGYWKDSFSHRLPAESASHPFAQNTNPLMRLDMLHASLTIEMDTPDVLAQLLKIVASAWTNGAPINWSLLYEGMDVRTEPLPAAPLNRAPFLPPAYSQSWVGETAAPLYSESTSHTAMVKGIEPFTGSWETLVRDSFSEVLQISQIGNSENFFDLGGCSLTALDVMDRLEKLTGVRISLRTFLHAPTVCDLACALEKTASRGNDDCLVTCAPCSTPTLGDPGEQELPAPDTEKLPRFSLFFFSGEAAAQAQPDTYTLLLDAARFADESNFEAVWVPERHFHKFGGLFPAPSVLAGALAMVTQRLAIRAGSIVLPLHTPLEIFEQWSVVDNLSGGRVGMAIAPGFHPTDFLLAPSRFADRRVQLPRALRELRELWRGKAFEGDDGLGRHTKAHPLPRPQQAELPIWITASESEQSFRDAGEAGFNILTALLALDVESLAKRITVYRTALDGKPGKVTVMLHTYIHPDASNVATIGAGALSRYLQEHLDFASPRTAYEQVNKLDDEDRLALVDHAVSRYLEGASLIGTPAKCVAFAKKMAAIGVDEIACLVDFGVSRDDVMASLKELASIGGQP
ncbi:MupA/Atu3671 family FMN-dependent luciferase-like monooxygenase [Pseudomonas purpurea]|uniref:MupA/Atu3671 family FMN-dependent luciferase-like monooxygenase n=1 Tax=Pseudomonas purpurea TaxID=3136737 RepID=UPI003266BDD3